MAVSPKQIENYYTTKLLKPIVEINKLVQILEEVRNENRDEFYKLLTFRSSY